MVKAISERFSEKAYAGIWGFIVGDALGVPFEFSSREEMFAAPATEMTGGGTHSQPAGTWSDDTSMLFCVLENNHLNGDVDSLAQLFLRWYKQGHHTAHGSIFDIGITTRSALERIHAGSSPQSSGSRDEFSAGNGSLMRCLPYAFFDDFSAGAYRMVVDNQITHRVTLCHNCCYYYIRMIRSLAEGASRESAMQEARKFLLEELKVSDRIEEEETPRNAFGLLFDNGFSQVPQDCIRSGGYVIDSLEAAVWSFMTTTDFKSAVLKAVNLGDDTDTVAALTGGLAGVYYGFDQIPTSWLNTICRSKEIDGKIRTWVF